MKKIIFAAILFLNIFSVSGKEQKSVFMDTVKDFRFSELIPVTFGEKWIFVSGKPQKNWQNQIQTGKEFRLTGVVLLDDVSGSVNRPGDEAVLYHKFYAPADGIAQIGIGCDWYFECFVNGRLCADTWQRGNGTVAFSPENHPFLIPVKKGENLLAIRTKRDGGNWQFTAAPLSGMQTRICALPEPPWTGFMGRERIGISFRTIGRIGAGIQYRTAGKTQWQTVWDSRLGRITRRIFHKVFLKDLTPGTTVEYRVVMIDPEEPESRHYSRIYKVTLPEENRSEYSFFFTADHQFGPGKLREHFQKLFDAADGKSCDFFVIAGDMGDQFISEDLFSGPVDIIRRQGKADAGHLIYARGNHEQRGWEAEDFCTFFGDENDLPFYLFRFGDTAFMVLDSWEDKPADYPGHDYCKHNLDAEFEAAQQKFLDKAVRSPEWLSAGRHIVLCHGAPCSHDDRFETMSKRLSGMTDKYFAGKNPPHKINFWFSGHKHQYMRTIPLSGRIAGEGSVIKPWRTGENYRFPVFTAAGPNRKKLRTVTAFRVDADQQGFTVSVFDPQGICMEKLRYDNDGKCQVLHSLPEIKITDFSQN